MDMNLVNRADWEGRRKIRLAQVRDQSKAIAKSIRDRVHGAIELQSDQYDAARRKSEHTFKSLAVNKLKSDFDYLIQDVGHGYSFASVQSDPSIVLAEKRLINRCKAISRGVEAEKRQKLIQDEQLMDKEMKERRSHFNRTVEKIRSTLITSIPNVSNGNNHLQNRSRHNKCFLIPSQVTLNESNIMNWNHNIKTSKPWSMDINLEQNENIKSNQSVTNVSNKENETKFKQLENDVRSYASLVSELDKLSAEEQDIRSKLYTHKKTEVPILRKNCIPSSKLKNDKLQEMDEVKHTMTRRTRSNKKQITDILGEKINKSNSSSTIYITSSESTDIDYVSHNKPIKKTICVENTEFKSQNSTSKFIGTKKFTPERPLKNINNTLQRIKNKKQLLAKEISVDRITDVKKSNAVSSFPKTSFHRERCAAHNDLYQESPLVYAKLPDSFYSSQIETIEKQISKKNIKKCNSLINVDLMRYINVLLKMTPSDIDNLSTSSCSSVKLEESLLEHSKHNTQFYNELLNCIAKCFNADFSEISQDTSFESPKNINIINRLQELTKYYSQKTHEMRNICDESSQILKEQTIKTENANFHGESSINISSDSSVDGEYVFKHLNTLMRKKGLIKSDKEWPLFEDSKDNDDIRSLTDQLLDV